LLLTQIQLDDVFWLGFLHLPRVPSKELYGHIKSGLLLLVRKDLRYNNIYKEYYETISWKADVLLPILDDDNIANIFAQKRQKLHSQIMVSENLILLQLASAILWMGLH
jgi:hypothetical protein